MASEAGNERRDLDDLLVGLSNNIEALDFISAMRLIESRFPEKPRLGEGARVSDDMVRLSQHISLSFKGPALQSFEKTVSGQHGHRLYCNFFGLLGSNGPMPLHYTGYADQRSRHHSDPTFREFLDLFNHRMLSLFYRASAAFDPAVNHDRPNENNFDVFIGALGGYMHGGGLSRDAIPDSFKRYQAISLGSMAKSPEVLEKLVEEYFDVPASVSEFVGGWLKLPVNAQISLDSHSSSSQLGVASYAGRKVWSIAHKFRLAIGPLDWSDYLSFKPGGKRVNALYDLVRNYVGDEWDWDINLLINKGKIQPCTLNRKRSLGFDGWLVGGKSNKLPNKSVLLSKTRIERVKHMSACPDEQLAN